MDKPKPDLDKYLNINISTDKECDISRSRIESEVKNNISEQLTNLLRDYIKHLKLYGNQEIPEISCAFHYSEEKGLQYADHYDVIDISLKEEDNLDPDVYDILVDQFKSIFMSASKDYNYKF
jgi:hypothetical protein